MLWRCLRPNESSYVEWSRIFLYFLLSFYFLFRPFSAEQCGKQPIETDIQIVKIRLRARITKQTQNEQNSCVKSSFHRYQITSRFHTDKRKVQHVNWMKMRLCRAVHFTKIKPMKLQFGQIFLNPDNSCHRRRYCSHFGHHSTVSLPTDII